MDNFKALPKLNEKINKVAAKGVARLAKVVAVIGNEVDVELTGGARGRYASTQLNVPVGQPGIIIAGIGGAGIFVPLHMEHPMGRHWHADTGRGVGAIQVGDTSPSNILDGATSFIAIGYGAKVGQWQAVAIGYTSEAVSARSVAVGWNAKAQSASAISIGYNSVANGSSAVAIGGSTASTNTSSTAVGQESLASGLASAAFGYIAKATGERTVAIGSGAEAYGLGGVAVGRLAIAAASRTVAIGESARASHDGDIAIGYNAAASYGTSYANVAIGQGAKATHANTVAIGIGAATTRHYEGRIKADSLIIQPSSTRTHSKLGLYSTDGTIRYIYFSGATLTSNATF